MILMIIISILLFIYSVYIGMTMTSIGYYLIRSIVFISLFALIYLYIGVWCFKCAMFNLVIYMLGWIVGISMRDDNFELDIHPHLILIPFIIFSTMSIPHIIHSYLVSSIIIISTCIYIYYVLNSCGKSV